jgi:hypothetical protein
MREKQKNIARWVCLFLAAMFVVPTILAVIIR